MLGPTIHDVLAARGRLSGHAVRTPLLPAPALSERTGARVYLKPECLQRTGSFKFRGAWNAVAKLGEAGRAGVVACSSGNHAQGLAEAARLAGIPATVVMPADAPSVKRERTAASGARIVLYDRIREDREAIANRIVAEEGGTLIHPFDNAEVIAGQGTVGLEIAEDCEAAGARPDIVLVPCGGGGLTAGVALAVTDAFPAAAVYAVEPAGFDDYARSLAAGERRENERLSGSLCDALLAPAPGRIGFEINRSRLAGALSVTDAEALDAVGFAFDGLRLVAEPGGAVALAAAIAGKVPLEGRTVVVVISGGNVADETLRTALAAYRAG
ncbi:threonine ammonia-lyase [Propylenella binzhouense]|uniref:Threonine/serine dehydratase n=1 Tax=Propylenella binzhouense TaxID=2555902 RepID=A0A964T4G6_9HYPH|nr:threonine/serine dehydratase [Propylenella binzhouense]MYZ47762.1 threonine/serine dehydratase [Propylenella binzhouense]